MDPGLAAEQHTIGGILGYILYLHEALVCFTRWQLDSLFDQGLFTIAVVLDPCCAASHIGYRWKLFESGETRRGFNLMNRLSE